MTTTTRIKGTESITRSASGLVRHKSSDAAIFTPSTNTQAVSGRRVIRVSGNHKGPDKISEILSGLSPEDRESLGKYIQSRVDEAVERKFQHLVLNDPRFLEALVHVQEKIRPTSSASSNTNLPKNASARDARVIPGAQIAQAGRPPREKLPGWLFKNGEPLEKFSYTDSTEEFLSDEGRALIMEIRGRIEQACEFCKNEYNKKEGRAATFQEFTEAAQEHGLIPSLSLNYDIHSVQGFAWMLREKPKDMSTKAFSTRLRGEVVGYPLKRLQGLLGILEDREKHLWTLLSKESFNFAENIVKKSKEHINNLPNHSQSTPKPLPASEPSGVQTSTPRARRI